MAIFKLINEECNTPTLKIKVSNMEISYDHWKSFKNIVRLGKQLEDAFYKVSIDDFYSNELPMWAINILKENKRIEKAEFYNEDIVNETILLLTTDVPIFRDTTMYSRSISIIIGDKSKYHQFIIIEVTNDELKEYKSLQPMSWIKNEELTTKLNNLKYFI
jgi:hypothetical protein